LLLTTSSDRSLTVSINLNQSNIAAFSNDFNVIEDQDLDAMIKGMVDRLLDERSENLASISLYVFKVTNASLFSLFLLEV
jgi:hypothetical protein